MVAVTRDFADRLAEVARLLKEDEVADETLRRLTGLGTELVPGATATAVTIAMDQGALTFAASDPRLDDLHDLQFEGGAGPVVEALAHNEPRRIDDTAAESRWPAFCQAAAAAGFGSLLALPLRTDQRPAGAVALYGDAPDVFRGAAHDIALLFAAQGGTAVRNASLYRACRRMADDLQAALESRAVIEQAKGILQAELGISPAQAFRLLSSYSQNTNQRVRVVATRLVRGRIPAEALRPPGESQIGR
jgi:GAF domain-containing protein